MCTTIKKIFNLDCLFKLSTRREYIFNDSYHPHLFPELLRKKIQLELLIIFAKILNNDTCQNIIALSKFCLWVILSWNVLQKQQEQNNLM